MSDGPRRGLCAIANDLAIAAKNAAAKLGLGAQSAPGSGCRVELERALHQH
jgi:hypothetical protein